MFFSARLEQGPSPGGERHELRGRNGNRKRSRSLPRRSRAAAAVAAAIGAVTALGSSASPPDPLFARVSANGTLRAGSPGVTVANVAPGQYEVTFPVNVSDCAYLSTTTKFFTQATQSFTAGGHNSVNGVFVETKNQGGGLQNAPFNLDVICGEVGTQFAVVGYDGGAACALRGRRSRNWAPGATK